MCAAPANAGNTRLLQSELCDEKAEGDTVLAFPDGGRCGGVLESLHFTAVRSTGAR